jgi:GH35 family endo-1,4-beta-xylanase
MKYFKTGLFLALLVCTGIFITSCGDPKDGEDTPVTFSSLTANGSATAATTKLTLTFDKDITGLTRGDISLNARTTGTTKSALTRTGTGVYELAVSGITANGDVTVSVTKAGYSITGGLKTVAVYRAPASDGVKVTTWKDLTAPTATNATQYTTYQGKSDVLHVAPSSAEYGWSVLEYSLNDYANKEITINVSMEVWVTTSTKVAWQVNQTGYPVIAGNTQTSLSASQWHTVTGSTTVTVDGTGKVLYLSKDQLGSTNEIYITNFTISIDVGSGELPPDPTSKTLTLTIGAKENLTSRISNFDPAGRTLTWSSNATNVATVTNAGIVTAVNFTIGGSSTVSSEATGTATITVTASGAAPNTDSFTINTTMESQIDISNLPPLKDQFASHFPMIGNITRSSGDISGGAIINTRLTRHFNVLTAENAMKPQYYSGTRNGATVTGLNFSDADTFVNATTASGFKVHAHVLLWHSQNSSWITALGVAATKPDKDTAIAAMNSYITQVMTRYKGKIYSWDVLNEVFPDTPAANANWKTAMRPENPWFASIGDDFVFEGYKAARAADPAAILYYNDYNLDNENKAGATHRMVRDVNQRWTGDPAYDGRLLIEGIGMQSHHNTGVPAGNITKSLNLFRQLTGVKISISEIDVLSMGYNEFRDSTGQGENKASQSIATNTQKLTAANLYAQYFQLFLQYTDIIERVTFWGLFDNASWRSGGLPLPFEGNPANSLSPSAIRAKPAYYKLIGALE